MYLCKFGGEKPEKADFTVFKVSDLVNEMALKIRSRSPKLSILHFATMQQYINFIKNLLFNSREFKRSDIDPNSKFDQNFVCA